MATTGAGLCRMAALIPGTARIVPILIIGLLDAFIIDTLDAALQPRLLELGLRVEVTNTIMHTLEDKAALARTALALSRTRNRDVCCDSDERL